MPEQPESRILSLEVELKRCWESHRACQERVYSALKDYEHRLSVIEGVWKLVLTIIPLVIVQAIFALIGGGK